MHRHPVGFGPERAQSDLQINCNKSSRLYMFCRNERGGKPQKLREATQKVVKHRIQLEYGPGCV